MTGGDLSTSQGPWRSQKLRGFPLHENGQVQSELYHEPTRPSTVLGVDLHDCPATLAWEYRCNWILLAIPPTPDMQGDMLRGEG
jgi:hypothetical protein